MNKIFAVLIISIIVYNTAYSQTELLENRISLHCSDMTILAIIQKISKQENIRFSYGQINDLNKKKSIYFSDGELKFILSKLFENTSIRYMAFSDQIILVESEKAPQKKIIKGYIVDDEMLKPIPYATVMSLNSGEGVIADYHGQFELEFDRKFPDTLKFASFGFEAQKISTTKIVDKNVIKIALKKDVFPIDQVHVRASDYFERTEGNSGITSVGALYMDTHGQEVALFIENKKRNKGKVRTLEFKLSQKGNIEAPFRIKIYQIDSMGKPGKEILKDLLVVKPDNNKSWFSVDITNYNITFPVDGFFISMSGVFPNDFNFYFGNQDFENLSEDNNPEDLNGLSYGQRLCYNKKGKNNTWHYSLSRKWFQLNKQRFNVMIKTKIIYKKIKNEHT